MAKQSLWTSHSFGCQKLVKTSFAGWSKSHLIEQFLGFGHDHNILPMRLPPRSMDLLQPLDVG